VNRIYQTEVSYAKPRVEDCRWKFFRYVGKL